MTEQLKEYSPPPFVGKFDYVGCKQINDPVTRKRVYQTPDGEKLPSVTTILDKTKDKTHLIEWRKRVGEQKAQQITTEAAGVGTAMHSNLERFIVGEQRQPGNNPVHVQANKMADQIIEKAIVDINEVWAMEQSLYFPGLYSGTADLIGEYKGNPAVMDYKQTNKPKKEEWVEDYYLQLMAYTLAHNEVYGTDIKHGHIFMCSRNFEYQQFNITPDNFNKYHDMWLARVEQYYGLTG